MKQVLVTGGSGFIGRAVTNELRESGYAVRVLDALVDQVHAEAPPEKLPEVDYIVGDIRDKATVKRALEGVDYVIHLAAEVGVGQSMYEISRYVSANDLGTAVLLEAMIDNRVERVVVASSMSVYGEGTYETRSGERLEEIRRRPEDVRAGRWNPTNQVGEPLIAVATDEHKRTDLASIYALTKYTQERAVLMFGDAYDIDAVALRLFNVFGPGQALSNPYTGVLANFASRLANRQPPTIFEDGEQRRDFVHVRDVARAFRLTLEKPKAAGQVINIGSGNAYMISEVAMLLADAMGVPEIEPEILNKARAGDIRNCFADIAKAREILGFQPRYRLEDSLDEIAAWVVAAGATDRGPEMRRHLEQRGLVS